MRVVAVRRRENNFETSSCRITTFLIRGGGDELTFGLEVMVFERPRHISGREVAHPRMATPGTLCTLQFLGLAGSSPTGRGDEEQSWGMRCVIANVLRLMVGGESERVGPPSDVLAGSDGTRTRHVLREPDGRVALGSLWEMEVTVAGPVATLAGLAKGCQRGLQGGRGDVARVSGRESRARRRLSNSGGVASDRRRLRGQDLQSWCLRTPYGLVIRREHLGFW